MKQIYQMNLNIYETRLDHIVDFNIDKITRKLRDFKSTKKICFKLSIPVIQRKEENFENTADLLLH